MGNVKKRKTKLRRRQRKLIKKQRKKIIKQRRLRKRQLKQKKQTKLRWVVNFLCYFIVIFLITYGIITFVGQRTRVSGASMSPTLLDGDNLIVDKLSYRFRDPKRYEIIVFPYTQEENTYYIKRIIGLPGETIQIANGKVYINGVSLNETFGNAVMEWSGIAEEPITLGEDEYFVLGDNRNNSKDSRDETVGVVKRDQISGRAWIRIWPLSRMEVISHE